MTTNKNNSEFTEWHDSIAAELADAYNVPISWAKEMVRTLDSMALGYHLGYSREEFREGQVSASVAQRAENAERALKEANRRYGIASEKIGRLRAEMALLREKNRELVNNPYKVIWTPRVFNDPEVEPPHDITLRSSKPLWTQVDRLAEGSNFTISWTKNPNSNSTNEPKWWCNAEAGYEGKPMFSSWVGWVTNYGPFTEVVNVAD